MLAIAEPSARLKLVCMRSRRALRTAASVSGSSTSSAITTPTADCGAPIGVDGVLDRRRLDLGEPDDRDQRDEQQPEAGRAPSRFDGGAACVLGSSAVASTGRK